MIGFLVPLLANKWTWIGLTVLGLFGGVGIQTKRLRMTEGEVSELRFQLTTALEANKTQTRLFAEQSQAVEQLRKDYEDARVRLSRAESAASSLLDAARQKAAEMTKQHVPRECEKAFKWAVQQEIQTRQARPR